MNERTIEWNRTKVFIQIYDMDQSWVGYANESKELNQLKKFVRA